MTNTLAINEIHEGETIEMMKRIPDGSVDMILADLPYGTTACKWDMVIPFEPLWEQYERIIKDNGAIVLTASQPFTSALVMSNPRLFSHSWVWEKDTIGNFLLANSAPLKNFEDIIVFIRNPRERFNDHPLRDKLRIIAEDYGKDKVVKLFEMEGRYSSKTSARVHASYKMGFSGGKRFDLMDEKMFDFLSEHIDFGFEYEMFHKPARRTTASNNRVYNPQGVKVINTKKVVGEKPTHIGERPNQEGLEYTQTRTNYPKAIIKFNSDTVKYHPTQKPIALFEYLIRTYTNEGEVVLDNVIGSGTTAVAAINTGRNFIGIEREPEYVAIANRRIKDAIKAKEGEEV